MSIRSKFHSHLRAISALLLHDIKTRFGASYLGFLVGLIIPLAHVAITVFVYVVLGRRAPIGTDVTLYLATAIVPFVVWSYTHQKVLQALVQNKYLLFFSIIKEDDIIITRSLSELLNSTLVVLIVVVIYNVFNEPLRIHDYQSFFFSLILSYLLGLSTGSVFAILASRVPSVIIIGFFIIPLYWITSGVFFIPDALPFQIRSFLSLFPLPHIVDFSRMAVYDSYISDFPSIIFVILVIIANFFIYFIVKKLLI